MGLENSTVTVEVLATQVADLRAANDRLVREVEALRSARPAQGSARAAETPATGARGPGRRGTDHPGSSRRGVLRTAAKVAAAAVAAGVIAEQVGTRPAFASAGTFDSATPGIPAVTAAGSGGASALAATSDSASYSSQAINSSNNANSIAIAGYSQDGSGFDGPGVGVQGQTATGVGVMGIATGAFAGHGVVGTSASTSTYGVYGTNTNGSPGTVAIYGENLSFAEGVGVYGKSQNGTGVTGDSPDGVGVIAKSASGYGLIAGSGGAVAGIIASSAAGNALESYANTVNTYGIWARNSSNLPASVAVKASSLDGSGGPGYGGLGPGVGLLGETDSGYGIQGTALTGIGIYGTTAGGPSKQAIHGVGTSGSAGLRASSDTGNGIVASSTSGTGLNVQSSSGSAVIATSNGVGYGLYLTAPSGWAIGCVGRIRVLGNAVGTATLAHATTSKTVSSTACSGSSLVLLTPTSNPQVAIWATAAPGAFTIHASSAPSSDVTFTYLLVN